MLAETKDFLTDSDIQGDLKVAMIHLITLFSRLQSYRIMRVTTETFLRQFSPTTTKMVDILIATALDLVNTKHFKNWFTSCCYCNS